MVKILKIESKKQVYNYLFCKRLAAVLKRLGIKSGDSIHIVVGNHHYSLLICFAASYLGGSASLGDPALDCNSIASQVNRENI